MCLVTSRRGSSPARPGCRSVPQRRAVSPAAMRLLRARIVGQRLAEEIRLPRLTLDQTASMTSATAGRPAPAQVVAAIQERSDGIPLHIEEFLAAITDEAVRPQANAAVQA